MYFVFILEEIKSDSQWKFAFCDDAVTKYFVSI